MCSNKWCCMAWYWVKQILNACIRKGHRYLLTQSLSIEAVGRGSQAKCRPTKWHTWSVCDISSIYAGHRRSCNFATTFFVTCGQALSCWKSSFMNALKKRNDFRLQHLSDVPVLDYAQLKKTYLLPIYTVSIFMSLKAGDSLLCKFSQFWNVGLFRRRGIVT